MNDVAGAQPAYLAPDGHGRYGILDVDVDGRVICHECGLSWSHLATHLRGTHGIAAAAYREAHGLGPGLALVGEETRARMAAAWERHAEAHTADLEGSRDLDRARASNRKGRTWTAQERAARQVANRRRTGRDLTTDEVARLGDPTSIPAWVVVARELIALDDVSAASIARVSGIAIPTVYQRIRLHPGTSVPGSEAFDDA